MQPYKEQIFTEKMHNGTGTERKMVPSGAEMGAKAVSLLGPPSCLMLYCMTNNPGSQFYVGSAANWRRLLRFGGLLLATNNHHAGWDGEVGAPK